MCSLVSLAFEKRTLFLSSKKRHFLQVWTLQSNCLLSSLKVPKVKQGYPWRILQITSTQWNSRCNHRNKYLWQAFKQPVNGNCTLSAIYDYFCCCICKIRKGQTKPFEILEHTHIICTKISPFIGFDSTDTDAYSNSTVLSFLRFV